MKQISLALIAKLNEKHRQILSHANDALTGSLQIGEALETEIRPHVPHGQWADWVEENCEFSLRTAQAYSRLYQNKAKLGDAKNLSFRSALQLLADPVEEVSNAQRVARGDSGETTTYDEADASPAQLGIAVQAQETAAKDDVRQPVAAASSERGKHPPNQQIDVEPSVEQPDADVPEELREEQVVVGVDRENNILPEYLIEVFKWRKPLTSAMAKISRLKMEVLREMKDAPLAYNLQEIARVFNNIRHEVDELVPHALCAYCAGTKKYGGSICTSCKARGWMHKFQWDRAPSDMKRDLKKAVVQHTKAA